MEDTNNQENIELKNRLLGLTSEVGGGIATDWGTSWLLGFGPWGWAGYGALNFGQGAYTNYLVQKHLYGREKVNWGEVWSSGGMSMIPFTQIGASAKYAKYVGKAGSVKRGIVSGAGVGLAGEQLRVGIDDGKWLGVEEALLATGIGGGLGGGLHALITPKDQLGKGIKKWKTQRLQKNQPKFDPAANQGKIDEAVKVAEKLGKDPEDYLVQQGLKHRIQNQINPPGQPKSNISPPTTELASPYKDWTVFGYQKPARTIPSQLRKVLGTESQNEVADSLWNFYDRANTYHKKHGTFRGFGEKFVNAEGKVYYVKKTKAANPRFTLENVDSRRGATRARALEDVQSSELQKILRKLTVKQKKALNDLEKLKYEAEKNELIRLISEKGKDMHRYNGHPEIQQGIAEEVAELGRQLDILTEGWYYGEHGYAISSKVWDYVKKIKRFAGQDLQFRAGDSKNYHLVFEPNKLNRQFEKTKDAFETVIDGTRKNIKEIYPDLIVGFNPVLSGRGKKIRIERLSTVKLGFKSRFGKWYPDLMLGDLVAEYDFDIHGPMNPAQIRKWLEKHVPGEKRQVNPLNLSVPEGFKKTKTPPVKIEDIKLKQSDKKKLVKNPQPRQSKKSIKKKLK